MRGEQGKEGAECDHGAGALTGHLREGAQGLTEGIAVTVFCYFFHLLVVLMYVFFCF